MVIICNYLSRLSQFAIAASVKNRITASPSWMARYRGLERNGADSHAATHPDFTVPKPEDVLALTPEDFGGVIIELMPPLLQNGLFNPATLIQQVYQPPNAPYPIGSMRDIQLAVAEAISWLVGEGFLFAIQLSLRMPFTCRRAARRL